MKCCCDVDLPIVRKAFAKRNWTEVEPHQDWNIYWTSVANARCLMAPDSNTRLSDNQRVNHFPTHYELTRKDLLARHMQRYQRQRSRALQRDEPPPPAIVPSTYVLPRDYSMFVDEYKKRAGGGSSLWIVKPCGKAQGIGIKLVNRPSQVKSLINSWESQGNRESHVLCRYVDPPLLVGGRKFDLRLYVLVTSFQPVHAFLAATTSPTVASGASPAWRRSCGGHGAPRPLLDCAKTSGSWWRIRSQPSRLPCCLTGTASSVTVPAPIQKLTWATSSRSFPLLRRHCESHFPVRFFRPRDLPPPPSREEEENERTSWPRTRRKRSGQ
nr:polyglutamylase complex subunit TTLL1-like isoform X4 [Dermacentor andersoni]